MPQELSTPRLRHPLEEVFQQTVADVRKTLAKFDMGGRFHFHVEAYGRVQDGTVKIQVRLGEEMYDTMGVVKGSTVSAVLEEFLRRKGWETTNAPLELADLR